MKPTLNILATLLTILLVSTAAYADTIRALQGNSGNNGNGGGNGNSNGNGNANGGGNSGNTGNGGDNGPPADSPSEDRLSGARGSSIQDEYLVFLNDDEDLVGLANALVKSNGNSAVMQIYSEVARGFSVKLPAAAINRLRQNPGVDRVIEVG
jgi:hypothetical protein